MEGQTILFVIIFCCLFSSLSAAAAAGDAALISAIAKQLVGVPSDWQSGRNPCSWDGIECTAGRITSINLNSKGISGTLPDSLAQLSSLKNLDLGRNQMSGHIPSLNGLSALHTVNLTANSFTSIAPDVFSGLTALQFMALDNNPIAQWSIPIGLSQCVSLKSFSATNTSVSGSIPDVFNNLPLLTELKLAHNSLTGGLPSSFVGSGIRSLYLNNQRPPGLSGRIDAIAAMPQLQLVWLQSNSFTGGIPDLSNLTSLISLNVRDNQLTGPVPQSLTSGTTLKNIVLSNNMLQGPFPEFSDSVTVDVSQGNQFCKMDPGPCDPRVTVLLSVAGGFGYPMALANSWMGNDPCSKQWTSVGHVTCDALGKEVMALNFPRMHYTGHLSPHIANLTSLTKIILSDNNLTGPIPYSLTTLPHLQLLDVTNNSLTGNIPDFPTSVLLKASGNPMLQSNSNPSPFGSAGSHSPFGQTPTSSSNGKTYSLSSTSHEAIIWGLITSVFVLVGCLACLIYNQFHKNSTQTFKCIRTWIMPKIKPEPAKTIMAPMNVHGKATTDLYKKINTVSSRNALIIEAQNMLIPFEALQKATNGFGKDNILSRGVSSVDYRGEHNGTIIVVKRYVSNLMGTEGLKELQAEIGILKKVRHRCLVALLGYCINANERLVVHEYMPNGTLGQHLFDRNENTYSILSWNQRLTIALDVARGIEYLHDLAQECFIHRDLNPSNILLDKDMRAKISNIGLVKLVDNEKSIVVGITGTLGYLAPEYAITGKISTKVDVYAFGVILMDIIMGRKAVDESLPDQESHLVKCFHQIIRNKKLMSYIDPTLDLDEEAHSSMSVIADLACHCTAGEPRERPDMGHVVNTLVPFVEKWNPSCCDDEVKYNEDLSSSLAQKLQKWQLDDSSTWKFDDDPLMMNSFRSYKGSPITKNDE